MTAWSAWAIEQYEAREVYCRLTTGYAVALESAAWLTDVSSTYLRVGKLDRPYQGFTWYCAQLPYKGFRP